MTISNTSKKYAEALLSLASDKNKQQEVKEDLNTFLQVIGEHPDYLKILQSPLVSDVDKQRMLLEAFDGCDAITKQFFSLLSVSKRLEALYEIALAFEELHRLQEGMKYVTLTSAIPLGHEIKKQITEKLSKYIKIASVTTLVDPSILGGYCLKIDNQIYDASLKNQLSRLKMHVSSQ